MNYDLLGLLSSENHINMTTDAFKNKYPNMDGDTIADIANEVQMVDFMDGSQDPSNSYWHCMSNGVAKQSAQAAKQAYENYVTEQIARCNLEGLVRALHAVQDCVAPGHKGHQPWYGGMPDWEHIKGDISPGDSNWKEGLNGSADIIKKFEEQCSCKN